MDELPVEEIATRDSWENHPMPESRRQIGFHRSFSHAEYAKIKSGHIPEAMEDKWFAFFEDDWVYFHRSWTGYCIFQLKLGKTDSGWLVEEAWVSQDSSQYNSSDDSEELEMLTNLFQWCLGI
jgi:hypothetical protein